MEGIDISPEAASWIGGGIFAFIVIAALLLCSLKRSRAIHGVFVRAVNLGSPAQTPHPG